ncbi:thioredoxin reductase 1, cytoplasmic-like [Acanthaster planci]|uniref:thioredoxin-disulfide reductase (NADPH) n=1 Tax=Acanthaster planci TaxID=133434 RepID=A0A8B7ZJC1_ACAPL|nr:thioredoxin reductase 1, cytoplasmic-like [Acanthaster planci]
MPPTNMATAGSLQATVLQHINQNDVMIFSKTTCPFCDKVKALFTSLKIPFHALDLDQQDNGADIQKTLQDMTGQRTVPNVFIKGKHLGGCDDTMKANAEGRLAQLMNPDAATNTYDYDLIVIGGGSGGLAAAKEAASFGKKVAVCDFVKPSPKGTTWGLGGTCVNVGCIPKKLMHQAALLGEALKDAKKYGWEVSESAKHEWNLLVEGVQDHIGSLNWGYKVALRDQSVTYVNAFAEFVDEHTIKTVNRKNKVQMMQSERFLLATGMRPRYPDVPGLKEYAITSDDLFSLRYCPGKTLCIGASYVSLECAGFLNGMGLDVTVMVRSILLRGFDQDMAEKVGVSMEKHGIEFIRPAIPKKIEKVQDGEPGLYRVTYTPTLGGEEKVFECNTVLVAVGRDACTNNIGLDKVGVLINPKNGKIPVVSEQTNIPHIYAVGDIIEGNLELTPVAIQAGRLLARRLYGGRTEQCDYVNVATTVFTPLEYGSCGLSEEDAIEKYGGSNIEVYHTMYQPLEYTVAHRDSDGCYAKIICNTLDSEKVVGMHILGPNAGEVMQGYAVAIKCGATKAQFDATIGIHPTVSEVFTTLETTKRSGANVQATGC